MDDAKDKKFLEANGDMMLKDFDDEKTLDEEEALAATEEQDIEAELNSLQLEGDMPLEELLALYGYDRFAAEGPVYEPASTQNGETEKPEASVLQQLSNESPKFETTHCLASSSRPCVVNNNCDYSHDEGDWKKTIMVGSDYQAGIPEGLCNYDDALPYENEDKLLWNPSALDEEQIEDYMQKISTLNSGTGIDAVPRGKQVRDDEQALFLLQQCGHNVEEAVRRRRLSATNAALETLWSEEECHNFENGLKTYGKDFYMIRKNKVKTRSVGELVQFYYLWKKTERHDIFANKARLEKKKYALHPGHTDYLDHFEEMDTESVGTMGVRPSSPVLVYAPETVVQPDPLDLGDNEVFSQLNHVPSTYNLPND